MRPHPRTRRPILLFLTAISLGWPMPAFGDSDAEFTKAYHAHGDGNYAEAYDGLRSWLLSDDVFSDLQSLRRAEIALNAATECLQHLNRVKEVDEFLETVAAKHPDRWQVLRAVANVYGPYGQMIHYGHLIAGEFERGPHRGSGQHASAFARDRVRAIQLYLQAYQVAQEASVPDTGDLLTRLAQAVRNANNAQQVWRLQTLTDLDTLPDYDNGPAHWGSGQSQGAPVDEGGNPIVYDVPASWKAATNDGERWRWALDEYSKISDAHRQSVLNTRANFLQEQFGVQTLASYGHWFRQPTADDVDKRKGIWALSTLDDSETIARLATGIKRITLLDEHNHLKLYQQLLELQKKSGRVSPTTAMQVAHIYLNRQQYPKAVPYLQLAIEHATDNQRKRFQQQLDQIVKNWGRFEETLTQPAGRGAEVDFVFRNANRVEFTAHKIDIPKMLSDLKAYFKSNPKDSDKHPMSPERIGHQLVRGNQEKYAKQEVARWSLDLEPGKDHFDHRITVTTPLQKAGAYLLIAKTPNGNTSRIVVWLADTVMVRKPMADRTLYYVADAVTGAPIEKANVEFFGIRQVRFRGKGDDRRKLRFVTKQFAEFTDARGQAFLTIDQGDSDKDKRRNRHMKWIAVATTPDGRLAFHGFQRIWTNRSHDTEYKATKVFAVTDRPVYRPEQTVEFKFWVRHAKYDLEDASQFAYKSFQVEIHNPRGEKVYSETLAADEYGGIEGKFLLSENATLGQYHLQVVNHGGGSFRVEEYKKPEFEVTVDAPTEPVALGEKITATISAKYYFGSPVTQAKVKYKVLRTEHNGTWYPPSRWDWLYGPGYWWFGYDYDWYPGWNRWGCLRPSPWWFWRGNTPPEVVAELEVEIGPDGTVEVEIDTALAKLLHPDQDHSYQIVAEVVDQSRRTIVGNGRVLVAREPFKVFAWVDRGHYRVGDTVNASFAARRLDGKPVEGSGKLKLLKLSYENDDEPTETEVRQWDLAPGADGQAEMKINASEKGVYRLSYTVTDAAKHTIEGGYVFTIAGEGYDGRDYQFNDLEIVPDQRDYAPGDKVGLRVNTNRVGSTVLLFVRPANGVYITPPQVLRLDGKSTLVEIDVLRKDMPNFYIEAVTISEGRIHTQVREIHVPPAKRVLNVEVVPSASEYQPGQEATIKLRLTDESGEPFVGSTVLTIYDKSVEYISGGSNIGNIKEFFWKWRRRHQPQTRSNLDRRFHNLLKENETSMGFLGIFGREVANRELMVRDGAGGYGGRVMRSKSFSSGVRRESWSAMDMSAPTSAAAPESGRAVDSLTLFDGSGVEEKASGAALAQPTVRQEFADTALWIASLKTDDNGLASAELTMPENLTTWKVRAWSMGHGTRVGEGTSEIVTRKNLIVRMQAPRFFVERDEVMLSANVHNYLPDAKQVTVRLELDGTGLHGSVLEAPSVLEEMIEIEAGGEQRVDWTVKVLREGEAVVRMLALTDQESDAVQQKFPAYVHGIEKMDSFSGSLANDETSGSFEIDVPSERRAEDTWLEVRYSPTLAGAMVDALPYLIDYPYGCTEQTLNRFLPAVITQQTLIRMGVDLKALQEKSTNLDAQQIGEDKIRAEQWKRFDREPVFDPVELDKIVKSGVQRLTEMQLSDGGWGWFSGWGEHSSPHTTATVVRGLLVAQANDVALVPGMLDHGIAWLESYQAQQIKELKNMAKDGTAIDDTRPHKRRAGNLDALVYMVLSEAAKTNGAETNETMRDFLYRDRTSLAVYSMAMFGMALHNQDETDKLAMIFRNLSQYVVQDDENQTAYLNLPGSYWWHWYGSEYEAHAYYLKLVVATDPKNAVAPRLVKYLLNNRRHATYWNSTRDTALVVEAMADYLQATGEAQPDLTVEIWIDGQKRKEVAINAENLFSFDNKFVLTGSDLEAGRHTVELRKSGTGPLYYNGYLTNFTLEDDIRRAGLELKVNRRYYKLVPVDKEIDVAGGRGQVVNQRVEKYDRQPIPNLGEVKSGDLVEIELVVESKNDYEYIILEDHKAAGFEPVELRSGYGSNSGSNAMGAYVEYRDERVSMFLRQLARGTHSVSYRMRAEIPGRFSALPTKAYAMYAPELKGNSDEIKIRVVE